MQMVRCTAPAVLMHPLQHRLAVGPSLGLHSTPTRSAAVICAARRFKIPTVFRKKEEEPGGDVYFSSEVADIDPAEVLYSTHNLCDTHLRLSFTPQGIKVESLYMTSFLHCAHLRLVANKTSGPTRSHIIGGSYN